MSEPPFPAQKLAQDGGLFVEGLAGTGKTTMGVKHLKRLLSEGVSARELLVLVPQRGLADPYWEATKDHTGGQVRILTISGLARRMIQRFWPLVAEEAGFDADAPPTFLTLETAQHFMARIVDPLREEGTFAGLTIVESRLYSQILDNINKAALVGFPPEEISTRLKEAWGGDEANHYLFDRLQQAIDDYLAFCQDHNLLDFSFQLRLFYEELWPNETCRSHLTSSVRRLIADNLEEGVPATHDVIMDWLPELDSALLVFDQEAGYRQFLGADPKSALRLRDACAHERVLGETKPAEMDDRLTGGHSSRDHSPQGDGMARGLPFINERLRSPLEGDPVEGNPQEGDPLEGEDSSINFPNGRGSAKGTGDKHTDTRDSSRRTGCRSGLREVEENRFSFVHEETYPQMLESVAGEVAALTEEEGVAPRDIVVVAPFLPATLRYALGNALAERDVPYFTRRPSRPLSKEPAAKALLALIALLHPEWNVRLDRRDVAQALSFSIDGLDLVRAHLLAEAVYDGERLQPFSKVPPALQDRITYQVGGRYSPLRKWIDDYIKEEDEPIDHVLARCFGEVLSQNGYGFHDNLEAATRADTLIESTRKFRQVMEEARTEAITEEGAPAIGKRYLKMVRSGVAAAQYVRRSGQEEKDDAVLLAPAHTYLMQNRRAKHQFWLDAGNTAWHSRIQQPLTNPHILSRSWEKGDTWTDANEHAAGIEMLRRLTTGLARRCEEEIHIGVARRGAGGEKQQGQLLKAFQHYLSQSTT